MRGMQRLTQTAPGLVLLACLVVCVLSGCTGRRNQEEILVTVTENGDQGDVVSHERILAQANAEGELLWYTSLPQPVAQAMLAQFHKLYPAITTRLVRGSTFDIARRADTEMKTAKAQGDVLHVLDVATFIDWKRRGALYRYTSPEERAYPEGYKDPGFWVTMRAVTLCIAYNSHRMTPGDAPRRWSDLLDPKWKGRVGLKDAATAGTAYTEYYFLRDFYGSHYWHRMADQEPRLYRTNSEMIQGLLSNEILIASGVTGSGAYRAEVTEKQPIAIADPAEGLPMMLGPIAIAANAPHPNCAKLFVDFALSQAGQETLSKLSGSYSVRPDVAPPEGQKSLPELSVMQPTGGWDAYYQAQEALQDEYARLFHGGRESD